MHWPSLVAKLRQIHAATEDESLTPTEAVTALREWWPALSEADASSLLGRRVEEVEISFLLDHFDSWLRWVTDSPEYRQALAASMDRDRSRAAAWTEEAGRVLDRMRDDGSLARITLASDLAVTYGLPHDHPGHEMVDFLAVLLIERAQAVRQSHPLHP